MKGLGSVISQWASNRDQPPVKRHCSKRVDEVRDALSREYEILHSMTQAMTQEPRDDEDD